MYIKLQNKTKDIADCDWEDKVRTNGFKSQLRRYYKELEKILNSESASVAQVGDRTSSPVAVSPKTPMQSPIGGRVATSLGISLVGSSRGTMGSSGSQRHGTTGSSGKQRAEGSTSLLWFMASCYGHHDTVLLEKIEQDFFRPFSTLFVRSCDENQNSRIY